MQLSNLPSFCLKTYNLPILCFFEVRFPRHSIYFGAFEDIIIASKLMYQYQPITEADGIRLIELQPSQEASAPLKCDLIHIRLSLCDNRVIFGHYTALFYVYGNPEKSRTVIIDGKRLDITNNLNSALLDLCDNQRTILLWADGMCINQVDNEEKARQI